MVNEGVNFTEVDDSEFADMFGNSVQENADDTILTESKDEVSTVDEVVKGVEDVEDKDETLTPPQSDYSVLNKYFGVEEFKVDDIETHFENYNKGLIEKTFEGLGHEAIELIKHLNNKGDYQEFIKQSINKTGLSSGMNLEDVAIQEKVSRVFLKQEGFDDEFIDERVASLKKADKLGSYSKKLYEVFKEQEKARISAIGQKQIDRNKAIKAYHSEISQTLADKSTIGGFIDVSAQDKIELPGYMTSQNKGYTQYERDIDTLMNNKGTNLILARVVRELVQKGNLDGFKSNLTNIATKEVKDSMLEKPLPKSIKGRKGTNITYNSKEFFN